MGWILALVCGLIVSGCSGQVAKKSRSAAPGTFTLPEVPAELQTPEQRAAYVVTHYWDQFDFADTTLISKPEITEQAFADYINLFPHTSSKVVANSISGMLGRALSGNIVMYEHFTELYEKYLDEPNSPFRQEEYFIEVLRAIIASDQVDEMHKVRPRYQLETALKNRVGDTAADFEFIQRNGRSAQLSRIAADYIILFFNNPDCDECARVKEILSLHADPRVKVVAIYPDNDIELWQSAICPDSWVNGRASRIEEEMLYDLRAIPTLYLLDKNKRVILKDAPVEQIVEWLDNLP